MSNKKKEINKSNFGFKKVTDSEKISMINEIFSDVANHYNLMNDIMSFGLHRLWKKKLCQMIPNLNSSIIDVASGTGDIPLLLKKKAKKTGANIKITACDPNSEMLEIFKARAIDANFPASFETKITSAENLPFNNDSFDYYTIAFGIRNTTSIEESLKEAYRVLKPTGKFLCLEFAKITNEFLRTIYNNYANIVIPNLGSCITGNRDAYQYLVESIEVFPDQDQFKTMIERVGFSNVSYHNLSFGTVAIHYGYKI